MENNESSFTTINNTERARDEYGHCYGSEEYILTEADIKALKNGKCLATDINLGEYAIFISMPKKDDTTEEDINNHIPRID